jgi:ubiquinone/menaquinone biosynthesis C-methylase UbiE
MVRVLDVGSGLTPDYRATDAIDMGTKNSSRLKHDEDWHLYGQVIYLGVSKKKIKQLQEYRDKNINFIWHVNYNNQLPYPDKTFDLVVSHASLASPSLSEPNAFREVYRVLKRGGKIEIGSSSLPKEWVNYITQNMKNVGFKKIQLKKRIIDTRLFTHEIKGVYKAKGFKNDVIYGVK